MDVFERANDALERIAACLLLCRSPEIGPEGFLEARSATFRIVRDTDSLAGFGFCLDSGTLLSVESSSAAARAGLGSKHLGWTITHVDDEAVMPMALDSALL